MDYASAFFEDTDDAQVAAQNAGVVQRNTEPLGRHHGWPNVADLIELGDMEGLDDKEDPGDIEEDIYLTITPLPGGDIEEDEDDLPPDQLASIVQS